MESCITPFLGFPNATIGPCVYQNATTGFWRSEACYPRLDIAGFCKFTPTNIGLFGIYNNTTLFQLPCARQEMEVFTHLAINMKMLSITSTGIAIAYIMPKIRLFRRILQKIFVLKVVGMLFQSTRKE